MNSNIWDCLPNELEIVVVSFVISDSKNWRRNWNNISLVSKHWNSIAWISFQRIIPKSEKERIFIQACERGYFHFINTFLAQDTTFDPSFQASEAIGQACRKGNIDIVKLLLQDKRVDPSAGYNYAIKIASQKGFVDIVKLLLQDNRVQSTLLYLRKEHYLLQTYNNK